MRRGTHSPITRECKKCNTYNQPMAMTKKNVCIECILKERNKFETQFKIAVEAFKEINHTYKPDSIHITVDKALADMEAASND